MKKKNIAILLLLPFVISLLGVITVNLTFKTFENDISHIEWSYGDVEVFRIGERRYPLSATGINPSNYPLAPGNELVWTVENKDPSLTEPLAEIVEENGSYYLLAHGEGEVILTCSNAKGNVTRRTSAILYLNSVIVVQTKIQSSQNNIDGRIYYGQYDLQNGQKVPAGVELSITCVPESLSKTLYLEQSTSNISFDLNTSTLRINGAGPASFTLAGGTEAEGNKTSFSYSFDIVEDGVNVYTYEDLLNCTNRSEEGEIVVLRKSFESLANAYVMNGTQVVTQGGEPVRKANNVELFGTYDVKTGKYRFADEVYSFTTTANRSYIDQWNAFADASGGEYKRISDVLYAALHVQKDFYGNGYTLNLHNLTFPSDVIQGTNPETGETVSVPQLAKDDLFRGPLPFYTLGDPNGMPLVTAHGQDNVGIYVEGDNITVNDVNVKNCDFGNSFSNLTYVGTVLETLGDGITIRNSVLQNGKNVMRAYSSKGLLLENCLLQNAKNFLLMVGSNEYLPIDGSQSFTFSSATGEEITMTLDEFLLAEGAGDTLLTEYLLGTFDSNAMMQAALTAIQDSLNQSGGLETDGSMEVKDTLFYRSGISSIALESAFNGPFLYNASPSLISMIFSMLTEGEGSTRPLVPLTPTHVSGVSAPVELRVTGSTSFYDYKTREDMDLGGLINENISTIATQLLKEMGKDKEVNVTIDDIFPLKSMLYKDAAAAGSLYTNAEGEQSLNVAIAFYGGGLNLSTVSLEGLECAEEMSAEMPVDWVESYLDLPAVDMGNFNSLFSALPSIMQKTVTVVTGFDPFRFVCMKGNGYLYGETPSVADLRANNQR